MAKIIAIAMQKGGVGKTTTALNLGAELATRGQRVLLIDLDPQANLTQGIGLNLEDEEQGYTIYEVLLQPEQGFKFAIARPESIALDVLPSTLALAGAEYELSGKVARESKLKKALITDKVHDHYDWVFIDCPPSLGLFTFNGLTAADSVLVPLQAHVFAYRALTQLEATIQLVRDINPTLTVSGVVCTMTDRRTNLSSSVEEMTRARYEDKVFSTVIPINTKAAEAPASKSPLQLYAPKSAAALAYKALVDEMEVRYAQK
jgi:chromosome partitioning protein